MEYSCVEVMGEWAHNAAGAPQPSYSSPSPSPHSTSAHIYIPTRHNTWTHHNIPLFSSLHVEWLAHDLMPD